MLLSTPTILILSSLLYAVNATHSPVDTVPSTPEGLVVLAQEVVEDCDGVLTFYGDADPAPAVPSKRDEGELSKRCGTNAVTCFGSHRADAWVCNQLINQVAGSGVHLQQSPRAICISINGQQCCISWADVVWNGQRSHLANAAYKVLGSCSVGGTVSGLTRDTQIGTACTTQCLSRRPDGCR